MMLLYICRIWKKPLVTAIAQDISNQPIKTFCIGFEKSIIHEAIYAKKMVEYLGTNHIELYIAKEDMLSLMDSIPQYFDEPFADIQSVRRNQ